MTAKTSQHLADVLRAAGFEDLAKRAEADEFHDFLSRHPSPEMRIVNELASLTVTSKEERERVAAYMIRERVIDGEFATSEEESDDWAASPEWQDAFNRLARGE